ncbi:MAG: carboxy terminal-processing peptidase [Cytophagaceae bacterium]|nr:carboxy terminal-processing peptidase [Cytophagaceae bacterium]
MKKFTLIIFALSFAAVIFAQDHVRKEALFLAKVLEKNHYSPRMMDDQFSKDLHKKFLEILDPRGLYFTSQEIQKLSTYRLKLDDEMKGGPWNFLPLASSIYKERLLAAEKTIAQLTIQPFNFSLGETISFSKNDSIIYSIDEKALTQRWNKWLKYQALYQLINFYGDSVAHQLDDAAILKNESAVREKLKKRHTRIIRHVLDHPDGYENYIASAYLTAFTLCYDPHSMYLSKTDRENLEGILSKNGFSFGMDFSENEAGNIKISRLTPGGPAWKTNELNTGDILIELKWAGKPAVDLVGADVSEVENMLESSNLEKLEITVRKPNGQMKTVSLLKEKMQEEEDVVKSFILHGEKKIGYISLPGFYSQFENRTRAGCANDVAKEIIKLQKENIEGLILDIRNNGGGALVEGLDLAGIFINEGPLSVSQSRNEKPSVMKDQNRGTIYDGPLLVMVNGYSASASELLASTLQDYNRAVIVGNRTYGKATMQGVIPIDTSINLNTDTRLPDSKNPYGHVSVTFAKLYRITGKTAQLKGVVPDIILPDINTDSLDGEAALPFALSADSITKKIFYTPLVPLPVAELAAKSNERVKADEDFQLLQKLSGSLSFYVEENTHEEISLSIDYFKKRALKHYQYWKNFESTDKNENTGLFKVENTQYENELIRLDSYQKEINDYNTDNIASDIYIIESFQIISDLINFTR